MGNKESTPEEGTDILREYNQILKGRRSITTTEFVGRVRKNLEREQRSSIAEEEKIKELFADKTHIEYRDFLKYKLAMGHKSQLPQLLTELFDAVDDGDGLLTKQELKRLEAGLGRVITLEEAGVIIDTWDSNGDGFLTVQEFIEYKTATMET